jgi:hypothetical protein
MKQMIPSEEIERAIDNFQRKVAALVAEGETPVGRREAAKKVLSEALALGRAEGVGLDAMKQLLLEEYGKPLPAADERAGTLVFNLFAWAAMAKVSLGKVGRWQAARIFGGTQSAA